MFRYEVEGYPMKELERITAALRGLAEAIEKNQVENGNSTQTARYVRYSLFAAMSGYSEKAIRRKVESGTWLLGREVVKAPDGCMFVDLEEFNRWVRGGSNAIAGGTKRMPLPRSRKG